MSGLHHGVCERAPSSGPGRRCQFARPAAEEEAAGPCGAMDSLPLPIRPRRHARAIPAAIEHHVYQPFTVLSARPDFAA
jgi:hypothetical protein